MPPQLSIIVPVYQAEKYLENCLDSILAQSFTQFELLLIDDGSTDNSGKICDNYSQLDSRVKVIHKKNEGQALARNIGIDSALGQYIGFVDNDDLLKPDMFEVLINNIIQSNSDISSCSFIQKDENGNLTHEKHSYLKHIFSNKEGVKEILSREKLDIYVWTKIYNKDFLDKNNIRFESGKNDEDILFNYQAYTFAQKTVIEDNPLYIYNHRNHSASRTYPKKYLEKYLSGTLYRVNKIESLTEEKYPELAYLAKRQKIIYCIQMLSVIVKSSKKDCNYYYFEIMAFLKRNKKQVFGNKKHLGMKYIGLFILLFLPSKFYFYYRKFKD